MNWEAAGAVRAVVADAFRQAVVILRERGWTQGRFVNDDTGGVDVVQALGLAVGLDVQASAKRGLRLNVGECVLLGAALDHMCRVLEVERLTVWNDQPERTFGGVCDDLGRAADSLVNDA